jgi:hypothetical protein
MCLALLSVLFCGGCATLMRGPRQTLNFLTNPSLARVTVDGLVYASPFSVSLRRKEGHHVTIEKPGYRTLEFSIDPQWDAMSLVGNILIPGGCVGLVADQISGANKAFYDLAEIHLQPTTRPDAPLLLYDYKGHLLTSREVASAVEANRIDRAQFFRGEP